MIKIGTGSSKLARRQAEQFVNLLSQNDITHNLSIFYSPDDEAFIPDSDENKKRIKVRTGDLNEALLKEEIDVILRPLKEVPFDGTEAVVTAGISSREDPSEILLIHKNAYVANKSFRLKENSAVYVTSERQQALFTHFRTDLDVKVIAEDLDTRVNSVRESLRDATVISGTEKESLSGGEKEDIESIKLNPREFIPTPGEGITAFQTRKNDIPLRKKLGSLTDRKLVNTINVERETLRQLSDQPEVILGVYCESDEMGHYHVWACYAPNPGAPLKFIQYSSSTQHELAETIVKKLTDDTDI